MTHPLIYDRVVLQFNPLFMQPGPRSFSLAAVVAATTHLYKQLWTPVVDQQFLAFQSLLFARMWYVPEAYKYDKGTYSMVAWES